jgi:hypothetical protein
MLMRVRSAAVLLASVLGCLLGAAPAAADPSGFREFAWGTPLGTLEVVMKAECEFSITYTGQRGQRTINCSGYQVPDLGPVDVTLKFNDQRLRGYTIAVRREREAQLRAAAPRLLQAPPASGPRSARTASVTFHSCMMGFACMTVQPL